MQWKREAIESKCTMKGKKKAAQRSTHLQQSFALGKRAQSNGALMLALHTKTVPPKSQLSRTDERDNPVKPC